MDKKEQVEENVEEVEKKKINWKIVGLWVVFTIVSLVGIFFLSTYIRWNAEIANKYEIIYTGQEEVQIKELKDFLGFDVDTKIESDQAIKAYCSSKFGDNCVTADYTSGVENALRSPGTVVSVVVLIDLIILYVILKDRLKKQIRTYIYACLIILFGFYIIGSEVFKVADYYFFVNNNKNVVEGKVIKELIPHKGKEFRPVISYEIDDKEYITDLDIKKTEVGKKINVYYKNKNYEVIEVKRDMIKHHIIPSIVGILVLVVGFRYLKLNGKERIKEGEEESK